MIPAFHAVAGDPAGDLWERSQQMRHDGMVDLVAELAKKTPASWASNAFSRRVSFRDIGR